MITCQKAILVLKSWFWPKKLILVHFRRENTVDQNRLLRATPTRDLNSFKHFSGPKNRTLRTFSRLSGILINLDKTNQQVYLIDFMLLMLDDYLAGCSNGMSTLVCRNWAYLLNACMFRFDHCVFHQIPILPIFSSQLLRISIWDMLENKFWWDIIFNPWVFG